MTSTAILIGNAVYERENDLPFCENDLHVFTSLIEATSNFDRIISKKNANADEIRELIRENAPTDGENGDIFSTFRATDTILHPNYFYADPVSTATDHMRQEYLTRRLPIYSEQLGQIY